MTKILIVDDHPVVRFGIKGILSTTDLYKDIDEAEDGLQAVEKCRQYQYSIVLLDVQMPNLDGFGALKKILAHHPDQKILMLSSISATPVPKKMLSYGAKGFLNKESALEEVIEAVATVLKGGNFISPSIASQLAMDSISGKSSSFDQLTQREMEVAMALIDGEGISQIAERLFLSVKTVSTYKARIWNKLSVKSERELFDLAREQDLL